MSAPFSPFIELLARLSETAPEDQCWAIVYRDEVTGDLSVSAPYVDESVALSAMEEGLIQINTGFSESDPPPWNKGWTASLVPCTPPETTERKA